MKTGYRLLVVVLAVAGLHPAFGADEPAGTTSEAPLPRTVMHQRVAELVKADVGIVSITPREEETDVAAPGETLMLEPLVVTGKIELPPPVRETRAQEFFRTGTLWEKVGPRFTRRFWVKGDRGIMFTLSW